MTSTDNAEPPKLDVYARSFVPQALKDVNEAPANVVPCAPLKWIDFDRYTSTFAGSDFFDNTGPKLQPQNLVPSPPETSDSTPNGQVTEAEAPSDSQQDSDGEEDDKEILEPHVYHHYFRTALVNEAAGQQSECEDHTLYRVRVAKVDPKMDPRTSLYSLHVPGLRELSLRIDVGDVVQLRQIRFNQQEEILSGSLIRDAAGNPINLPRKHDTQHNSIVWVIDRFKEELSLRIDNLTPRSMLFNAKFTTQSSRFKAMYNAVITTQNALSTSNDCWMRSMLFPQASDGYYQKSLNRREHNLDLHDELLNYEQSRAVATVVNENYGPVPYIISGPPGTGKTKTMVELALQLVAKQKNAHLLICAPSDPAADTLVQRLSKHLKPAQLLRINSPARNFPEVPTSVLPFCFVDDGMFSLPPFAELMRKLIVVTTCRDADILVRTRITNNDLYCFQQNLHAAIHPNTTPKRLKSLHWTGLLIDEAAQSTEPEALIPLTVVAPPNDHNILEKELPVFVMAGDQHQLGPRTASKNLAITTSVLERLLDRPFYAEHPLARSKQSGGAMRPLTQAMLPILRPAFTNLIRNYRSHPAILATPSKLFYNDTLEREAAGTDALSEWPGWQGRGWPVLFSCNTSPDEIEQDGGGWYNNEEAKMACQYAASLLQSGMIEAHDICIMSPFRAQVRVLRKLARAPTFAISEVNIGPLEAFQGLEKRVVIICTTRTRDRFLDQDLAKGLGVIHEPRRFNVALTRAMHGLVVIGNPFLLDKDENWRTFMAFCERNGLWEDKSASSRTWQPKVPESDGMISRLEKQIVRKEDEGDEVEGLSKGVRRLGLARDPEQELWQSGVKAEMAIGDEK